MLCEKIPFRRYFPDIFIVYTVNSKFKNNIIFSSRAKSHFPKITIWKTGYASYGTGAQNGKRNIHIYMCVCAIHILRKLLLMFVLCYFLFALLNKRKHASVYTFLDHQPTTVFDERNKYDYYCLSFFGALICKLNHESVNN